MLKKSLIAAASVSVLMYGGRKVLGSSKMEDISMFDSKPVQPLGPPWDHNWDRRALESCVKPPKYAKDIENYESDLHKAIPKFKRNIILISHDPSTDNGFSDQGGLTGLGRSRARMCAQRLKAMNLPTIKTISCSSDPAHTQTGEIFNEVLTGGDKSYMWNNMAQMLKEGKPEVPDPPDDDQIIHPSIAYDDEMRMEAAFRQFFHRASREQNTDSYDVIICHPSVVSYMVLRVLQMDTKAWRRLDPPNASITWIEIFPNGHVALCLFGDAGHLPSHILSSGHSV